MNTPGFTGDCVDDGKALWNISYWVSAVHRQKLGWAFHGVIYVYTIGSHADEKKSIGIAQSIANLIGDDMLKTTVVVTAEWKSVNTLRQQDVAEA